MPTAEPAEMEMKMLVVNTALKDMLQRGYLSITTIKEIVEILGIVPPAEDMQLLSALHCVHFDKMPPALLRGLPFLIKKVLNAQAINFSFEDYNKQVGHSLIQL